MLPLSNRFVDKIDSDVGEDGRFNRDYVKQVKGAATSLFEDMCKVGTIKKTSDVRACNLNKPSITKAMLVVVGDGCSLTR